MNRIASYSASDLAKIEQALRSCPGKIQGVAIESTYAWY